MRKLPIQLLSLCAVLSVMSPAAAQDQSTRAQVAETLAPVDPSIREVLKSAPAGGSFCAAAKRNIREGFATRARFAKDLAAQVRRYPTEALAIRAELASELSVAEAFDRADAVGSVRVAGAGFKIGEDGSVSIVRWAGETPEEFLASIHRRMVESRGLAVGYLVDLNEQLDEAIAAGNQKRIENLRDAIQQTEEELRSLDVILAQTPDTFMLHGVRVEGVPSAVLSFLEPQSVLSATLTIDPARMPSVIRRVMDAREIDRKSAIRWINNHGRKAGRMRGQPNVHFRDGAAYAEVIMAGCEAGA